MGDVIRREKTVPVQARRADGGGVVPPPFTPGVVDIPAAGGGAAPPAVAAGGAVQNYIYVVAPPAGAPPIQEVHHHHHTTQVVAAPRRRRLSKGTSFLGTLGLVVGGLAGVTAFLPQVAPYAKWMAEAGLGLAALAWAGAVLFRRVGAGMPFLGMVVSAAAYGLWLYTTNQAQSTYDQLRVRSPVALPAVQFPSPPAADTPAQVPASPATPVLPRLPAQVKPPVRLHDGTIFDPDSPGWVKPGSTTKP